MKTYAGVRLNERLGVSVTEDGGWPKPLRHYSRHSPDGFAWGYSGSGPSDLALAILTDAVGGERAETCYTTFRDAHVARWSDRWEITEAQVVDWVVAFESGALPIGRRS